MSTGAGIGTAAQIVGTELQGWAALLEKWNMGDAYRKQIGEQQGFADQGRRIVEGRLDQGGVAAANKEMAQGQNLREGEYKQAESMPFSLQGASPVPGAQNKRNQAYTDMLGAARARMGSYGDWLQQQWVKNQDTNRRLGQVSGEAAGSAGVFPLQMYKAQHSMDTLAAIGQAISSIGGSATNFGSLFGAPNQVSQGNLSGSFDFPDTATVNDLGANQSLYAIG